MTERRVHPGVPADDIPSDVRAIMESEPGVGFSIVDADGIVRFVNARAAQIFLKAAPEDMVGKSLVELYGEEWAQERLDVFDQIMRTGNPAIMRHIRNGRRVQSTIRPMTEPEEGKPAFLVITVEGEHDPRAADQFEIVESKLAHLGPLELLSKREMEVLALIGHGMTAQQIAESLHCSARTVEHHCDSLRVKLRSANRVKLAEFARDAGLRLSDAELQRVD